ncbi:unnamed protein product [Tilletia laevis]|uniref:Uncharacterized protein n=1 Tax=Tilletia controversa TaxID=13291 RepID=A0A8X7SYR5_9BASI|nr:hypothetical protein CF328_g2046 [Tilletia controversa]CAD6957461.1 unnamed protein product [Tilletia laevis]CAD7068706.1 unnamed protein product [Tilletia caries]KAE8252001.1 hypothetical protein A4X06_0g2458 [Tilletia controversa]CAD6938116.1 unnamed protein product [Tilletia controversa]
MGTIFHPIEGLHDHVLLIPEQGQPNAEFNAWMVANSPLDVNPMIGHGWVWIIRRRGEQYGLDADERLQVLIQKGFCESLFYEAGLELVNIPDLVNHPGQRAIVMGPVEAEVQQVCRDQIGLREGEWLFFLDENDDRGREGFAGYFTELAESFRAGPLSQLNGNDGRPVVTAVKISGMEDVHPDHEEPCICVLFENGWLVEHARAVHARLREHHDRFEPFGVKSRLYSSLGLYRDNVYGTLMCHYLTADM